MTPFFRITLRTTGVEAATAFYAEVLGPEVELDIVRLHEQAIARGARPHWLGFLDVGDVERVASLFAQRGATALGPKWVNPEGLEALVVRDPGGAIVALAKPPPPSARVKAVGPPVAWYMLHTSDVVRAKENYREVFGWRFHDTEDLGFLGVLHPFSWAANGPSIGAMIDVHERPDVHPHWLFYLGVPSLEEAVNAVGLAGGIVKLVTLPTGGTLAVCEDPQGAAFGLCGPGTLSAATAP
jgi:uncharacterized protein